MRYPKVLLPTEQEFVRCLSSVWVGQRSALCRAAGGGGLLLRALHLLSGFFQFVAKRGGGDVDDLLEACIEAAADVARPLNADTLGRLEGRPLLSSEVATAEGALGTCRDAALSLLCARMPRPAEAMVWVEEEDDDIELEEELAEIGGASVGDVSSWDMGGVARSAMAGLLAARDEGGRVSVGHHLLSQLSAGVGAKTGAGLSAACRATWALDAALGSIPSAGGVGAAALAGLMGAVRSTGGPGGMPPEEQVCAACAALLLGRHPLACLNGGAAGGGPVDVAGSLEKAIVALCGWSLAGR